MADYVVPLKAKQEIAIDTLAFTFDTSATDFTFKPGQYAYFTIINPKYPDGDQNRRIFSFLNSPTVKDEVTILARIRDTGFKKNLAELEVGESIQMSRAIGFFNLHQNSAIPAIFIAGGVGIAPLFSHLNFAVDTKLDHKITLFYSNQTPQTTPYLFDLLELKEKYPSLTLVPTITRSFKKSWPFHFGRVDTQLLTQYLGETWHGNFYLAGPVRMVDAITDTLLRHGVPLQKIRQEAFTGY